MIPNISDKSKERGYLFPFRRTLTADDELQYSENLSTEFRTFIDNHDEHHHYALQEIIGYIYALIHAPTYRIRHAEFLQIDFPRVPFPELADDFETLSGLGWALIQAHLLRELPRRGLVAYHGKGGPHCRGGALRAGGAGDRDQQDAKL